MKTMEKERGILASISKTPFKDELFLQKNMPKELYDVVSLRNGKKVKWNSIPLDKKRAEDLARDVRKSGIPSVEMNSIEVVRVAVKTSVGRTDEEWKVEENFNNFKIVWDDKIKELEGELVQLLKAINRKNISDAFSTAERMRITLDQGLKRSGKYYEKWLYNR
jgi:hypothetical protein